MLLSLMLAAAPSFADEPTHDIVPADAFTLDAATQVVADRTGSALVFVRARWSEEADGTVSDLWRLDVRNGDTTRLTFLEGHVGAPEFGAQSKWVYFLADDDDGLAQVFRIAPTAGATPQQLTHTADGVDAFRVEMDGHDLWFSTTADEHGDDAFEHLRDAWSDLSYVDRTYGRTTLHTLDLQTWRTAMAWDPGAYVLDFDITDDGGKVAAVTAPDDSLITHEGGTDVVVWDADSGDAMTLDDTLWRAEAPSPYGWLFGATWASDGRALAFRIDFDGFPGATYVAEFAGDGPPEIWALDAPGGAHATGSPQWVPGKRELCQQMADRARVRLVCDDNVRAGRTPRTKVIPRSDVVIETFTFSGDGRDIYAVVGTPSSFPELFRLPARGSLFPIQLSDLNPHVADWKLPKVQVVKWTAPDGTTVEGILETPYGWTKEQGPLPTVVHLHGGPTWHTPYRRRFRYQGRTTFAAAGYALFSPNYRGSIGYGDEFLVQLVGREADVEVADILSGVDFLVDKGVVDADKLAVTGWSNGGFLTNVLISQTNRFKAASSGAGVSDQTIQWALEDTPGHVINYMQGLPWAAPEAYAKASPLRNAGAITTPTIFHVGEHDARVPAAHAKALFRALDVYTDVDTELVIYPDTGHGLRSWTHRAAKLAWDLAWFDQYVLNAETAPEPEPAAAPVEAEAPAEPEATPAE